VFHIPRIKRLRHRLYARLRDDTAIRAARSAIVFAPHQDDETLGCGGTIILKSRARAPLTCVFMTDGATSHHGLVDADELRRLRRAEALDAVEVLGIDPRVVLFLDFPDGRLAAHGEAAVARVLAVIESQQPEEVYVPYRHDGTPDHEATYRIVAEALKQARRPIVMLEYPVWVWNTWPWVPLKLRPGRETLAAARRATEGRFGRELRRSFGSGVHVSAVLETKRLALSKHRSQMMRLGEGPWPTLADVSDGAFLECFFQDYELFRESVPESRR
jgi:LmbE family N-acetylglucosaminyl deacetylase